MTTLRCLSPVEIDKQEHLFNLAPPPPKTPIPTSLQMKQAIVQWALESAAALAVALLHVGFLSNLDATQQLF